MASAENDGTILAFSADQVSLLTGLSHRQLGYWNATGFFSPEYAPGYRVGVFSRVYSFRDVVGLYTIALLRKKHRFSLQQLRRVGEYLHRHHETPWASLALYVAGRDIVFREPADHFEGYLSAGLYPGQEVIPIEMEAIAREVQSLAERMRHRRPQQVGRIEQHRYVVHNAPVLAGTRIPTAAVWNLRSAGYTTKAIIAEYPRLRPKDVTAALTFEKKRRNGAAG